MNLKEFGENVRRMRKLREMTGEKMAEKCNITPTFLRQIESGAKRVSVDNLVNICNVLNVSPAYLLSGDLNTMEDTVHTKADLIKFIDELSEEDFKSFLRVVKMLHMQL